MGDDTEPKQPEALPERLCYYFKPENAAKIMSNKKSVFGTVSLIVYLGQFVLVVGATTHYSSYERLSFCNGYSGEEASGVYDTLLLMLSAYHIIEWVRATILLCAVLVGVNLI